VKSAQTSETAARKAHIPDRTSSLASAEDSSGAEPWTIVIVGVRAVVLAVPAYLLAFLWITVPVVKAVLLVGVNVSFLFFAASGNCHCSDKGEGYVEGAFSSHGSLHYSLVKND
jgi:hypothetical protein